MAQFDYPRGLLQRAIREGANATDALRTFRAEGGRIATQTWYRLYGQAQLEGAMVSVEARQPGNRIPTAEHVQPMTTRRARGFMQRATVYGVEPGGLVISKHVSFRTDRLRSRDYIRRQAEQLLQQGAGRFPQAPDSIPMRVIFSSYAGTYDLQPEE